MKWREKIKTKLRVDSHISVFKGNPIEHLVFYYLYRLLKWFVIAMVGLLALYEIFDYQWIDLVIVLIVGSCLIMALKIGATSEYRVYKECLKDRKRAYEQIKKEDSQALRKKAWLDNANQGKTELKQKLNNKEK